MAITLCIYRSHRFWRSRLPPLEKRKRFHHQSNYSRFLNHRGIGVKGGLQPSFFSSFSSLSFSLQKETKKYIGYECYRRLGDGHSEHGTIHQIQKQQQEKSIFVCGDGDLSYGASIAAALEERGVHLVASVLESERQHLSVYRDSAKNIEIIKNYGHEVLFEVNATSLPNYFETTTFDRIQFNFPHWRGKTNNRRNRELISDFFASSKSVLSSEGQIHMALLDHQGGAYASSLEEWKQSWIPARYAAENGLLLTHVLPFQPNYNLSAYQWKDRPFRPRGKSQMYIFSNVSPLANSNASGGGDSSKSHDTGIVAPIDLQLYSYFNLYIALSPISDDAQNYINDDDSYSSSYKWTNDDILNDDFIQKFVQSQVPNGIRTEVHFVRLSDGRTLMNPVDWTIAEYQIVFFGESLPLTQSLAEVLKENIEKEVCKFAKRSRKGKWKVSNVNPSSVLQSFW